MAFLEIDRLEKKFGAVDVLKGIDLDVDEGGFLVLVGPSGCGKSTLLNTIAGLEQITSGEIRIAGRAVNGLHPSERDIAMVFQSYALYPNMTVAANIGFGMEMRGVPKEQREKAIIGVADMLQISHLLDRKPSQLSGGQRQRVAMGRALVRRPKLFLFDEPLSNLDAKLRVDMRTEIKRLHARLKTTIVYVTHDQIEAMTLATKIAVLRDGILQQAGTPYDIYNSPANMFVADFMGSPAMNLLSATVTVSGDSLALELEQREGKPLLIPMKDSRLSSRAGQKVIFGIRPEAITDPEGADRTSRNLVEADCLIEVVQPAGADTFAITHLGGKETVARLRADTQIAAGQVSRLAFNLDRAVFFDPKTELLIE
jgi:multiple sugar transport system ATP-binding protein